MAGESKGIAISPRMGLTAAFAGTSLLWFAHFAIMYGLAETACNTPRLSGLLLGVPVWKWLSIVVSFGLGGLIAVLGLRGYAEALRPKPGGAEQQQRRAFMGRAAAAISVLYLLVVLYLLIMALLVPPCN